MFFALAMMIPPPTAFAAVSNDNNNSNYPDTTTTVFNHEYADPFHPLCKRRIQVNPNDLTFHYSGTAVGPKDDPVRRGCSTEEIQKYGLRQGAFDGNIIITTNGQVKISAGDGVHEGVWEAANSVNTNLGFENLDGIRWNDGNKWTVIDDGTSTSAVAISTGASSASGASVSKDAGSAVLYGWVGLSALAGFKGIIDKFNE